MGMLFNVGVCVDVFMINVSMILICLVCQGYVDCIKFLLDWGVNFNYVYEDVDVFLKILLMVVVESDCVDCVKILVECGVDINMVIYMLFFILVVQNFFCECSKILLDFGVDFNFSDCGKNMVFSIVVIRFCYGYSYKLQKVQLECIKLLFKFGVSVDKFYEGVCVVF